MQGSSSSFREDLISSLTVPHHHNSSSIMSRVRRSLSSGSNTIMTTASSRRSNTSLSSSSSSGASSPQQSTTSVHFNSSATSNSLATTSPVETLVSRPPDMTPVPEEETTTAAGPLTGLSAAPRSAKKSKAINLAEQAASPATSQRSVSRPRTSNNTPPTAPVMRSFSTASVPASPVPAQPLLPPPTSAAANDNSSSNSFNMSGSIRRRKANVTNLVLSKSTSVMPAPAPAMYWSRPTVHGVLPHRLRAHSSVVVGDLMYVFGGTDSHGCLDTLYILELDTFKWMKPHVHGDDRPTPSRAHCAVVVTPQDTATISSTKIYVFGGGDANSYSNALHVLDTDSLVWSRPQTSGPTPCPRRAHSGFVWRGGLYIFAGGDGQRPLNDLHRLDLETMTWAIVDTTATTMAPRGYHSGTLVHDKFIVFGGSDGQECFGDVFILDLVTRRWSEVETGISAGLDFVPQRLSHAATNVGSYIFVTGGHNGKHYCNDLLLLNIANMAWETRKVYGIPPSPRGYHSMVLHDGRLFLFGGFDGKRFYDEIYVLDLSSSAYLPQITNFSIDTVLDTATTPPNDDV